MKETKRKNRLDGKVALVTGASRGIGRAISIRLAQEGAHVLVHFARDIEAAHETERQIRREGGEATLIQADFSHIGGVDELFKRMDAVLVAINGGVVFDILVNNAGIAPAFSIEATTESTFDEVFSVNVKAPFFIAQKAIPRLRDGGRIINLSSLVTRIGYPPEAAYSMSKGAIDVLSRLLAKELGPRGITVNSLAPGVIETDMNRVLLSDPASRKYVESISALGRVGTSEDVADVAAFLASSDSRWITGQYVDVSGGSFIG